MKKTTKETEYFGTILRETEYFGESDFYDYEIIKTTFLINNDRDFKDKKTTIKNLDSVFDVKIDSIKKIIEYKTKFINITYTGRKFTIIDRNKEIFFEKIGIIKSSSNENIIKIKGFEGTFYHAENFLYNEMYINTEIKETELFIKNKKTELKNETKKQMKLNSFTNIIVNKLIKNVDNLQ